MSNPDDVVRMTRAELNKRDQGAREAWLLGQGIAIGAGAASVVWGVALFRIFA